MCNCSNTNKICGCSQPICKPTNCACTTFISSDCVNNVTAVFECAEIETGLNLTETLEALDQFICTKFGEITNYFSLISVGNGAKVYKGVDNLGRKEIRSIIGSTFIDIEEGENEITPSINEENLTQLIENLIGTNLESIVAGNGIAVDNSDSKNPIISVDADLTVIEESSNPVSGGAVFSELSLKATIQQARYETIVVPISDMITNLTTGISKSYFRIPFNMTLVSVSASVYTPQSTGSFLIFDINQGDTPGSVTSVLSTKITIENDSYSSLASSTQPVISNQNLLYNKMITFDIDQVGTLGAKGAVITLKGYRTDDIY